MKANLIPYGHQSVNRGDIQAVVEVLQSDRLTQGPKIKEFEKRLAGYCGARYAVAVSNGTAALHLVCMAAGVSPGDEVITTPMSFLATSNCILYCGAKPVFADIESNHLNIDPLEVIKAINRRTKVVLPVHFAGHPCDLDQIQKIARRNHLTVIEDGCHALGAKYKIAGKWFRVGGCSHSDACVFSFHPVKSITMGEGGAVTTNRTDLYEKLLSLRTHGIVREQEYFQNTKMAFLRKNGRVRAAPWYYEMQSLGFNYRITDMQCAMGIRQLSRINDFLARRRYIVQAYRRAFEKLTALILPQEKEGFRTAYHLFPVQLDLSKIRKTRAEIFEDLKVRGIGVQVHYVPIHLQPYYRRFGYKEGDFPQAETYYERTFSLPLFPAMTTSQINQVIKAVKETLFEALKD